MKITCKKCHTDYEVYKPGRYECQCGEKIDVDDPGIFRIEPEQKACPACGETILAVAKKCKHCGEWLDGSHQEPKVVVMQQQRAKKSKGVYVLLTLLLGNWGAGEFYIGNWLCAIFILVVNMVGLAAMSQSQSGIVLCALAAIAAIICMIVNINDDCFDAPNVKPTKPTTLNKISKWMFIFSVLLCGAALYILGSWKYPAPTGDNLHDLSNKIISGSQQDPYYILFLIGFICSFVFGGLYWKTRNKIHSSNQSA